MGSISLEHMDELFGLSDGPAKSVGEEDTTREKVETIAEEKRIETVR